MIPRGGGINGIYFSVQKRAQKYQEEATTLSVGQVVCLGLKPSVCAINSIRASYN